MAYKIDGKRRKYVGMEIKEDQHHFACGLNFYKLYWIFFIGCILGVIIETFWCLLTLHRYESRAGLVYGPFSPVYGFGAVVITLSLYWMRKKNDMWQFLGGFVVGSAFEYLCSVFQERVFGTVSWQYDSLPLNINGRITILYSFFWGVLAIVWLKEIYPRMCKRIGKIPNKIGKPLTWITLAFMIINIAISCASVYRMSQRHNLVEATTQFDEFLDEHFTDERLKKIYPNMIYTK